MSESPAAPAPAPAPPRHSDGLPPGLWVGGPRWRLPTPLLVLYTLLVWIQAFAWMGWVVIAGVLLLPFVSFARSHNWIGGFGMGMALRGTGSRIRWLHHPRFDRERRSVFCQNHVNIMDAHAACATIPHSFCGLMNAWQFKIPVYGWIMSLASGIPVFPREQGRTEKLIAAAKERTARGISILVFPEGHRTMDGRVQAFRRGVFFMARGAGIPVVPLAVRGMRWLGCKQRRVFQPADLTIYVGPQIETEGLDDEQVADLAARLQRWVAAAVESETAPTLEQLDALLEPAPSGSA